MCIPTGVYRYCHGRVYYVRPTMYQLAIVDPSMTVPIDTMSWYHQLVQVCMMMVVVQHGQYGIDSSTRDGQDSALGIVTILTRCTPIVTVLRPSCS